MKFNRERFFAGHREYFGPLHDKQVEGLERLLAFMEADAEMTDLRWLAYALATCRHETAFTYQPIMERGARTYFNKYELGTKIGKNLGNTAKGDGYLYRGRGYVQITGRANYARFTKLLQVNLLAEPDIALEPNVAYLVMSLGMRQGLFTGKKLSDYINEAGTNYVQARRIINGLDKAQTIAGMAVRFEKVLNAAKE